MKEELNEATKANRFLVFQEYLNQAKVLHTTEGCLSLSFQEQEATSKYGFGNTGWNPVVRH